MPQSPAEDGRLRDAASAAGARAPMSASALSAHSDAVQAAAGNELDRSAYRMLAAVLAATVDHDRTECVAEIDELAVVAKLSRSEAIEALAELHAAGILSCDNIQNGAPGKVHIAVKLGGRPVPGAAPPAPPSSPPATLPPPPPREPAAHVTSRQAPVRSRRRFRRARRLSWGVADQGLSSATNLALSILVAHAVGVRAFGVFGLAFATYTFALGVTRSLCSEPLAVRFSSSGDRAWRTAARSSTGTVLALSIPMGAACVAVGTIANSATGDAFVALGICLPGLVLQDAWRMAFFSNGRGRRAFVNDLVWAVIQIPAMLVALSIGVHSASPLILCWGVAATVAAVYGVIQSRVIPEPGQAAFWLGTHRDIAPRYFVEFLARYGANAGTIYVTALVAGVAAAGAFRAGQVLLGPVNLFNIGLTGVAVYEAVRLREQPRRMRRMALLLGAGIAVVSLAWGGLMLAIPDWLGQELLSRSWNSAHSVLLPLTVAAAASGVLTGATVGLRGLAAAKRSLRVRLITAIVTLVASAAGAELYGAPGAATGLAIGLWIGAVLWILELNRAVAEAIQEQVRDQRAREARA
jgi:O-antigen/teichoic acid export membrane protein